mmetsp:Transcript_20722/g.50543  ORF Transcript_20722/g.50543 Transcript_20722/m.50543 type:complete len:159 (+) Transcript_20722:346-822(+)
MADSLCAVHEWMDGWMNGGFQGIHPSIHPRSPPFSPSRPLPSLALSLYSNYRSYSCLSVCLSVRLAGCTNHGKTPTSPQHRSLYTVLREKEGHTHRQAGGQTRRRVGRRAGRKADSQTHTHTHTPASIHPIPCNAPTHRAQKVTDQKKGAKPDRKPLT